MSRNSRPPSTSFTSPATTAAEMKIQRPKLPRQLEPRSLDALILHDEGTILPGLYENGTISGGEAGKVMLEQTHFKHIVFDDVSLPGAEITDVIFEHCDLSNVNLTDAIIHRTHFIHCKMVGLDLLGSTLRNIRFTHCLADYSTFRFANLKQVAMENSSFTQADFYSATLNKVRLHEINIDKAQFSSTPLRDIDISTCEFHNLGITLEDLQGCIISPPQAILFTKIFGLVVKDE